MYVLSACRTLLVFCRLLLNAFKAGAGLGAGARSTPAALPYNPLAGPTPSTALRLPAPGIQVCYMLVVRSAVVGQTVIHHTSACRSNSSCVDLRQQQ